MRQRAAYQFIWGIPYKPWLAWEMLSVCFLTEGQSQTGARQCFTVLYSLKNSDHGADTDLMFQFQFHLPMETTYRAYLLEYLL